MRNRLTALALVTAATLGSVCHAEAASPAKVHPDVVAALASAGTARVLVRLAVDVPKERFSAEDAPALEAAIQAARETLRRKFGRDELEYAEYRLLPVMALEGDAQVITALGKHALVRSIRLDGIRRPSLGDSVGHIGAPAAWRIGGTQGIGSAVAVLDTGIDRDHPFIADRLIDEACFSTNHAGYQVTSLCPSGANAEVGHGAAGAPDPAVAGFDHGTHVAGIAMGENENLSGVAPAASLVAVQVFSRWDDAGDCGDDPAPCVRSQDSDVLRGMEYVLLRRIGGLAIRAINLSLGDDSHTTGCDDYDTGFNDVVGLLRLNGVSVVAASGNDANLGAGVFGREYTDGIGWPACAPGVLSVGSVTTRDEIVPSSQASNDLDILAPGAFIESSVPDDDFAFMGGTSMAAPHVAGALAVLADAFPQATAFDLEWALLNSGVPLLDDRSGNDRVFPRLDLAAAARLLAGIWPPALPPVPSQLAVAGSPNRTDVTLAFSDGSDREVRFEVSTRRASDVLGFTKIIPPTDFGVTRQTALITGLARGTAYLSKVRACDDAGRCSAWTNELPFTTFIQLPQAPSGFRVTGNSVITVNLAWNALPNLSRWELGYSGGVGAPGSQTPAANATSAVVGNRTPGETYRFTLRACNADGCGPTVQVLGATQALQNAPVAPSNLTLVGTPVGLASLRWSDRSLNEMGFEIWRAVATPDFANNPNWTLVASPRANVTTYNAPSLAPTINYFKVRACNVGGCSAFSNEVTRF